MGEEKNKVFFLGRWRVVFFCARERTFFVFVTGRSPVTVRWSDHQTLHGAHTTNSQIPQNAVRAALGARSAMARSAMLARSALVGLCLRALAPARQLALKLPRARRAGLGALWREFQRSGN